MVAVHEIVFQHLLEKLQAQQVYLSNVRNQASISAAISGLVATFFGSLISGNREVLFGTGPFGLSLVAILGLFCFGASIAFSGFVVVHTQHFTFSFDTEKMLDRWGSSQSDDEFYRSYISDGEWFFRDNEQLISKARSSLLFSLIFGFSQIIPWSILLVGEVPK